MRILVFFLTMVLGPVGCFAQRTQQDYETELVHKPLYLRGLWEKNELRFNGDGTLAMKSGITGPLMSSVEITGVELKADQLVLSGRRLAMIYGGQPHLRDMKMPVQIVIKQSATADYDPAIQAIFATKLSDLAAAAPEIWQFFLTHDAESKMVTLHDPTVRRRIGGGVQAPIVTSQPEPEFSEQARKADLHGNVLVYLQVDTQGRPTHLRILRPLGMGLDESAAAAVSRYRFKPAMENGQPVEVEMNVEVNFQ